MKVAKIHSVCECQARLSAVLDENKQVLSGAATELRRHKSRTAPAQCMNPGADRFDVGWACPFCGRNVLRPFDSGGLAFRDSV